MDSKEDELQAKREARRRKILENSKNRLGRISGREQNDTNSGEESTTTTTATTPESPASSISSSLFTSNPPKERIIYPDPEDERDVYVRPAMSVSPQFGDPNSYDNKEFQEFLSMLQQNSENGPNLNNFNEFNFANLSGIPGGESPFARMSAPNPPPPKIPDTKLQKFLKTKIHIGVLSILTYILLTVSSVSCNVFLVFLLWEVMEIFLLRQHETTSGGLINIICMLAGIPATKVNIVLKWIQLINKVLRDVAIFLFFFVLSHIIYIQFFDNKVINNDHAYDVNGVHSHSVVTGDSSSSGSFHETF